MVPPLPTTVHLPPELLQAMALLLLGLLLLELLLLDMVPPLPTTAHLPPELRQAMALLLLGLLLSLATVLLFLHELLLLLRANGCQLQHPIPVLWQTMRSQGRLQLAQSNSS
jgi:hypothetical protein